MLARIWKPGSGSQDLGSQDLVAKMMKKHLFYWKSEILETNNDSRRRFVNIALENIAVAAARVVGDLSAAAFRGAKSDVYKTPARIFCFVVLEARWLGSGSIALKSARPPTVASSVWGKKKV